MKWLYLVLKISFGLFVIGIVALVLFFYSANKSAQAKNRMIEELAKVPIGSSVADTLKLAESLGFELNGSEFAIPHVVEMKDSDEPSRNHGLPEQVTKDTDFSKFKNGSINFGLSLFLFQRKGCEITFENGKVTATRVWALD